MINENWMRSISQSYKTLKEQQMMMSPRPTTGQKRPHHPFRTNTAGPIQDEGPASVEPPKQNPMFPGPGAMGEVPGPQGKPVAGTEQSVPMMGMGQPQQQPIQIARMGTFKQPFGEVPGQMPQMGQMGMGPMGPMGPMGQMPQMGPMGPMGPMGQMPQMGPMGPIGPMGQMPQMGPMGPIGPMGQSSFGAPGQNIQDALSKTRPITKIEPLENRDVPDEFRYAPRAQQQPQQTGGMPQTGQRGMGQMPQTGQMGPMGPMGQMPQTGQQVPPPVPSTEKIKMMMKKIGQRGLPRR